MVSLLPPRVRRSHTEFFLTTTQHFGVLPAGHLYIWNRRRSSPLGVAVDCRARAIPHGPWCTAVCKAAARCAPSASGKFGSPRAVLKGWGSDAVAALAEHLARTPPLTREAREGSPAGARLGSRGVDGQALHFGRCGQAYRPRAGVDGDSDLTWRGGGAGDGFRKKGHGLSPSPRLLRCGVTRAERS